MQTENNRLEVSVYTVQTIIRITRTILKYCIFLIQIEFSITFKFYQY